MTPKSIAALIGLSLARFRDTCSDVRNCFRQTEQDRNAAESETGPRPLHRQRHAVGLHQLFAWNLMLSRDQLDAMRARLPKWATTDTFEIRAVAAGTPTQDQMRLMLQSLLADRFSLKIHFETTQAPVLALVLDKPGKTGPRLRPHSEGPPCDAHTVDVFPPVCDQLLASGRPDHAVLVGARDMTMGQISTFVSSLGRLDRPVVDQTGLSGNFDFTLEFTKIPQPDIEGTTLQEALQDQLGLKLKTATMPLNTLVVDHVERPSEN